MKWRRNRKLSSALAVLILYAMVIPFIASGCQAQKSWSRNDALQGVVCVFTTNSPLDRRIPACGRGSAFGVGAMGEETDIFVTNRHVVFDDNTNSIMNNIYILLDDDAVRYTYLPDFTSFYYAEADQSKMVRCQVLYPDKDDPEYPDVAIIKAERKIPDHVAIPLKSGFLEQQGDSVYTMGFPDSADKKVLMDIYDGLPVESLSASTEMVTVGHGVISRTVEVPSINYTTMFQHTAPMNRGNSGGPLVNEDGYAVGINTYGFYSIGETVRENDIAEYKGSVYVDYAMRKLDELNIAYDQFKETTKIPRTVVFLAAAAVAVVLVTVLLVNKPQGKKPAGAGASPTAPAYRLQGINGAFAGRRFPLERPIRIGRDPALNDLVYPPNEKRISGVHCVILPRNGELYLQDCNSRNGTYLNGIPLPAGREQRLNVNDMISLAGRDQSFKIDISHHA